MVVYKAILKIWKQGGKMKVCDICGKEMKPGDYYILKNNH